MKLIFDENLSPALIRLLASEFAGSIYVRALGGSPPEDLAIWEYAREHGFAIITKDTDFQQLAFLHGHPPKVIWLRCGKAGTSSIHSLLLANLEIIKTFFDDRTASLLILP